MEKSERAKPPRCKSSVAMAQLWSGSCAIPRRLRRNSCVSALMDEMKGEDEVSKDKSVEEREASMY